LGLATSATRGNSEKALQQLVVTRSRPLAPIVTPANLADTRLGQYPPGSKPLLYVFCRSARNP